MSSTSIPMPKNGVFTITTGAPGAPTVTALLSTDTTDGAVTGTATSTQVVSGGAATFKSSLHGVEHATGLGGVAQVFSLQGAALPPLMGAKHISTMAISLSAVWGTEGTASYTVYNDTPTPVVMKNVPVKVQWLLTEK